MPEPILNIESPIRLCAVSYLNTRPFIYGLEQEFSLRELQIERLVPSGCADAFLTGSCDVGLLPVGALLDFKEITLLDQYCIGADGFVDSVFLFANQPVETLEALYLDSHSRTSNGLVQILMQQHWHRSVSYLTVNNVPTDTYLNRIEGPIGGVVIGDRAIAAKAEFRYVYDLARAWKDFTGLPFAFAVWAYRTHAVPQEMLHRITRAFRYGMAHIPQVAAAYAQEFGMTVPEAEVYLRKSIDYEFDGPKRDALALYLKLYAQATQVHVPALTIA